MAEAFGNNDPRTGSSTRRAAPVLDRNIHTLLEMQERHLRQRTGEERFADAITAFAGSMRCVYLHLGLFGLWVLINSRLVPVVPPLDPYPFAMLAMFASVEAIFLSTFVLISQNRQAQVTQRRDDMELQINLLAEHEITTVIRLVDEIAKRMGVPREEHLTSELKKDANPELVLASIERAERLREQPR